MSAMIRRASLRSIYQLFNSKLILHDDLTSQIAGNSNSIRTRLERIVFMLYFNRSSSTSCGYTILQLYFENLYSKNNVIMNMENKKPNVVLQSLIFLNSSKYHKSFFSLSFFVAVLLYTNSALLIFFLLWISDCNEIFCKKT